MLLIKEKKGRKKRNRKQNQNKKPLVAELIFSLFIVSSVGRAPDYRAGGRGFKPRPDQHSGSLNNCEESVAFAITSANGW